ncbi:hypothetical protein K1719_014693 [Acacia pycnantha]|nr:hypothetical protein K1719_014693 [Acacia pycnantha]
MDNILDTQALNENPSKLDCVGTARNLESLKLWGVLMVNSPKWDVFQNLKNLEIIGARLEDPVLCVVLRSKGRKGKSHHPWASRCFHWTTNGGGAILKLLQDMSLSILDGYN